MAMASLIVDFPPRQRLPSHETSSDHACYPDVPYTCIPKKRSIVRFSPTAMLHAYEHPPAQHDSSHAAIDSSWYSPEDELQFKQRARREILLFRLMKAKGRSLSEICADGGEQGLDRAATPVGLEQHLASREYTRKRALTKRLVALAVLTEQARPVLPSEDVDVRWERIAAAARRHSEWSRTQAKTIGSIQALSSCTPFKVQEK